MTVRPDNRLSDAPMRPVTCGSCGARVLARKSSWEQTSVQWSRAAMAQCLERRRADEQAASPVRRGLFLVCAPLRASIEAAVLDGALPVLDGPL
ncbi:hypothetical protein [[Mycobacterium] wendilense]|uniref:Ferredoxin n=1 Tax=[Mycobacterium] wendilense TaxID=3064284 RepID=A0ABM9MKH3_9MYCO|nr:hypothetical protein [Mycolicibacterium sp. MU0050]CAJ1587352.1 hypothetical protein MU0050_004752 [Mycolicibacterium sp. MU0050]